METIYKYDIPVTDRQTLRLPAGAKILHVADQAQKIGVLQVWALVEPNALPESREIVIVGTGDPVPEVPEGAGYLNFIGTTIQAKGALVWHVFEEFRYEHG